jgi:hypothetical protein
VTEADGHKISRDPAQRRALQVGVAALLQKCGEGISLRGTSTLLQHVIHGNAL